LNDNSFEYFSYPTCRTFFSGVSALQKYKGKKKRYKVLKGFTNLSLLPTIKAHLLHTLKRKLMKKSYLKSMNSKMSQSLVTRNALSIQTPESLLLNFQLQQGTKFSPILIKYLITASLKVSHFSIATFAVLLENFFFSNRFNFFKKTNLISVKDFNYILQKKILKIINFDKFKPNVILWYYTTIIRFIEFYSGKKVFFKLNPFIENALTFSDLARCNL